VHEPCVIEAPNADACDLFGLSLAASTGFMAVGAPLEDGLYGGTVALDESNELLDSGAVYIYSY
jgi:hypothetical protein